MAGLIFLGFLLIQAEKPLSLLSAILIHEAAHLLTALIFTRELPRLSISGAGLRLSYSGLGKTAEQITVSAAGPVASILTGLVFYNKAVFSLYSLGLGMINLLPISVLDGGGILRAMTEKLFMPQTAFAVCRTASIITTLLIFALNCVVQLKYGTNLSLAVISVFLTLSVLGKEM